jgi:alpha-mannosidase
MFYYYFFENCGGLKMLTFNRRRFIRVSGASLVGTTFLEAAALGMPQIFLEGGPSVENGPYQSAVKKLQAMTGIAVTGWKWHADNVPHPEDPSLNDHDWQALTLPAVQQGRAFFRSLRRLMVGTGPTWFRKWVQVPRTMGGYNIQGLPVKLNLRVLGRSRGPIRVFSNGSMVEMTPSNTQQPILLMDKARPGRRFLIAAYSPGPGIVMARLEVDYPPEPSNPLTMYQEILCVQAASKGFPAGRSQRSEQLGAAVQTIDFGALSKGDQSGFNRSLVAADEKMQPLAQWIRQFTIRAVGNSHIDLAWLWPWEETVEVVRDTFGTVLELQDEYPHLYYAQSSAQDFLWLERYYPQEFLRIKAGVQKGTWELVGGMWCEPDLNMPCGESLVRQLLTGKRYFQQKFGVDVKIGWNPDSFGYSWQLAQIYKRSGVDYFVTQKISWNDTAQFPYKLFQWESPDGSRVLTYFPHGYGNRINPVQDSEYVAEDTPLCSGFKQQMLLYGMGDHGGGPTRQMLDSAMRWVHSPKAAFPEFKFSTAQEFFDEVKANIASLNLPVWKNELYLQYHRGTYTTEAESKRRMRESEELMLNSEKFCSLAMLHGRQYPQQKFEDCWRRVCFNQFHDMMAGSGIHVNYADEAESLEFLRDACLPELHGSLDRIAARIDTRGPGVPVAVFNPLSWERTDVAEAEIQFPERAAKIEVRDPEGHVMPSAEVSRNDSTTTVRVRFLARSVPALGYKVFHLVSTDQPRQAASALRVSGLAMENEFLRVEVDAKTGCVASLVSKKVGSNILRSGAFGNLLETFVDRPKDYEAWNIGWPYEQTKTELLEAEEVKLVENTPIRAVIRVKKRFQNSSFIQDICMYPEIARADVHMHADWHEQRIMLKVAFPLAIAPLNATYEIPYGTIERPAIPHVPGKPPVPFTEATGIKKGPKPYDPLLAQEAEFEVCAQRWGDLSENGRGFSLLNNCKYGYDTVEKGTIRLTLLRSPRSPEPSKDPNHPFTDQGPHDFTYSMYPHAGDWREAGTERAGYELNYPVMAHAFKAHEGSLPQAHSFVQIQPANVILTAIKKAEDDNSVVFRFFEFEGKDSQVRLTLPETATAAVQTNLMEKEERPLTLGAGGRQIDTPIGHYEIKSVKVTFPNAAGSTPPRRV